MNRVIASLWAFTILLSVNAVSADVESSACTSADEDCVAVGDWQFALGFGLGGRTNPVVEGDDQPIILLPSVSYYADRFFWETDTLGYTLVETPRHMVNVIATVSYDQIYFDDYGIGNFSIEGFDNFSSGGMRDGQSPEVVTDTGDEQLDGVPSPSPEPTPVTVPGASPSPMPSASPVPTPDASPPVSDGGGDGAADAPVSYNLRDRDMAGLIGVEYSFQGERLGFGLQILQDFTDVHSGMQVRLGSTGRFLVSERGAILLGVGAEWKDSKTLDYYYGVRPEEVSDDTLVYQVDDGVSYYIKLDWRRRLSRHWELRAIAHNRWFDRVIYDSPIVAERSTLAVFFGGVYHF